MAREAEEDELELENDEDEEDDEDEDEEDADDDDDDEDDEVVQKDDLLEEIADTLGENMAHVVESDIDEDTGNIILTMNDESKWKLSLKRM